MTVCAVKGCHNSSDKHKKGTNITFHQFPADPVMNERWAEKIRLNRRDYAWKPSKMTKICSVHFENSLKYNTDGGLTRLRRGAIPTRNLHICCSEDDEHHDKHEGSPVLFMKDKELQGTNGTNKGVIYIAPTSNFLSSTDDEIESAFDTPRQASLRKQLKKKTILQGQHRKKIKTLQMKIRRLMKKNPSLHQKTRRLKKNGSLQQILVNLRKERYINNDISNVLKEYVSAAEQCNSLLKKDLKSKSKRVPVPKYTPEFKKFCVILHFYSPQAYNYVLKAFNSCLPDPKIIYNWYRNSNGSPGLTEEAFEHLKLKVKSTERKFVCALIADEILIQPQNLKSHDGCVDFGIGPLTSITNASEACTFMLVCLNEPWEIPLGYFFVNAITGSQKKNLINMCLTKCEEVGVKVVSVTFNANATNISAAQLLGYRTNDPKNMKTTFKHPTADHEVAIFFDPSNMLKLIRDQFENKSELLDQDQNKINWGFLTKLNDLQRSELASKLIQDYIDEINDVNQDDQLLRETMAGALKFCREVLNLDEFKDSEGTEIFITIMSDLFDIFNSKWSLEVSQKRFCQPLSSTNKQEILDYLEKCKKYIHNLQIDDTRKRKHENASSTTLKEKYDEPELTTKSLTGFKGMLVCIESLKHLFYTLVEGTGELSYIPTYRFSQEPIKSFIWSIKMLAGPNIDYPSAVQFRDGYRHQVESIKLDVETTSCAPTENVASKE